MRYLAKLPDSRVVREHWRYPRHREQIREELRREQRNFCAYSERYLRQDVAPEIEHFDDEIKNTDADGYRNWYLVTPFMNRGGRGIAHHRPVLHPSEPLDHRIRYVVESDLFHAVDPDDVEARNLIAFLGWNDRALVAERRAHVERVRKMTNEWHVPWEDLRKDPSISCDFATALEATLGLRVE